MGTLSKLCGESIGGIQVIFDIIERMRRHMNKVYY
ncbi:hypothetical protein EDC54_11538 [Samsonia erythrinae]|uniref:Uncharacterized protein n=1 Tax=Samsonia erythrinae TaxID=160434 RepID=A0A4R3VHW9_9GAMM|nr:hypothetical protein EDC54_11538 [Samsonia erythrinae]